jgi:iron transport multicopper oxidase
MDPPMPTLGNAGANTVDFYDLSEANVSPAPLPDGFETKGIVAMTFSILAGLLGVGTVIWYGLGEMGAIEADREKRKIDKVAAERGVVSRANTGLGDGQGLNTTGPAGPQEEITRAG